MNMIIGKISKRNFIIFLLGLDPLHNQLETTSLNLVKKYTEEWYQNTSPKEIKTIFPFYFTGISHLLIKQFKKEKGQLKNDSVPWETEF